MIIIKTTIGIVSIIIALSIMYLIGRVTRRIIDPEEQYPGAEGTWLAAAIGILAMIIATIAVMIAYWLGEAVLRAIQ
jgi:hypothetical protein